MKIISAVVDYFIMGCKSLWKFWESCNEDSAVANAARAKLYVQIQHADFQAACLPDYMQLGNAVLECVQNNCQKLGLSRPVQIEDVIATSNALRVTQEQGVVNFHYEIDRPISTSYEGGCRKHVLPLVPLGVMKPILENALSNYAEPARFSYLNITMFDVEGSRVALTINDVRREDILL